MILIDWLSVYQDYPGSDYPRLASEVRTSVCALTGELLKESTTGYQHQGSFDSSILIKFDGYRLSMSGNPSSWNQRDNLFGVRSVRSAVAVYNRILVSLGYPEFYDCENSERRAMPFQSTEKYYRPGLKITRVDLTKNFSSDTPCMDMLRYLSSFSYRGQPGYLYPNGMTVDWMGDRQGETGGSKRLYFKYYSKAWDLDKKLKKLMALRHRMTAKTELQTDTSIIDYQITYLTKLLEYALENNIIRFELELKSKKLEELNLDSLVGWDFVDMKGDDMNVIQLNKYMPHINQVLQFNRKIDLYSQLLDAGYKEGALTRNAALLGQSWLDGHDIDYRRNHMVRKTSYYQAHKILLTIGFDIKEPLNIVHFPNQVCTFMLKDLVKPDFYEDSSAA
ncbi:MAG: phage/plasmid replication protein [Paludibacter sp.]|nr:phage/plasmid replication protein [Paludibacter sp.]